MARDVPDAPGPAEPAAVHPDVPSEAQGLDDMRSFIGHAAWKAAPAVQVDVDDLKDLVTVTCYRDLPDVELDPHPALSVGFHNYRGEYLLTSLCLYGVERWPDSEAAVGETPLALARELVGPSACAAIRGLLGGGSGTIELCSPEAATLVTTWRRAVQQDGCAGRQR